MAPFPGFEREIPWDITDEDVARLVPAISGRRGVITAGARTCRSEAERRGLLDFARALGWPLFADAPSQVRVQSESVIAHFDATIRSGIFDDSLPEVVIRLGALLTSKATNQWLARSGALQLGIDRHGLIPDPDAVLSQRFTAVPASVTGRLAAGKPDPAPQEWTRRWSSAAKYRPGGDRAGHRFDIAGCDERARRCTRCAGIDPGIRRTARGVFHAGARPRRIRCSPRWYEGVRQPGNQRDRWHDCHRHRYRARIRRPHDGALWRRGIPP